MYACVHAYVHAYVHVYAHIMCVHSHVSETTCTSACVFVCNQECVCVCVCAGMGTCFRKCLCMHGRRALMHMYACVCVYVRGHMFQRTCTRACVCCSIIA